MRVVKQTAPAGFDTVHEPLTQTEFDEDIIRTEVEELAQNLYGAGYDDLALELKVAIRSRAIEALWPDYPGQREIGRRMSSLSIAALEGRALDRAMAGANHCTATCESLQHFTGNIFAGL